MSEPSAADFLAADAAAAAGVARRLLERGDAPTLAEALLREIGGGTSWNRQRALDRLALLDVYDPLLPAFAAALADSADAERRNAARSALTVLAAPGSAGPDAAIALLAALARRDPDPDVRVLAVAALGEAGQARGRSLMEELLDDPDPNLAAAAAESLGQLADPRAVPPLLAAAEAGDFWKRASAVVALGRIRDARAVPVLARAAADPWLAAAAAQSLGEIGDPAALEALRAALPLGGEAREAALRAASAVLGRHPGAGPPPWLREALRGDEQRLADRLRDDPEAETARLLGIAGTRAAAAVLIDQLGQSGREETAAIGLALLPPETAVGAILDRLEGADAPERAVLLDALPPLGEPAALRRAAAWLANPDAGTRAAAAEALGRSEREPVLEALASVPGGPDARAATARVLGHFGEAVCAPLLRLLADAEPRVRAAAADSLGRCGATPLADLREALGQEADPATRQALARALGRIGGAEAAAALLPWTGSDDVALRFTVLRALGESGADAALPALLAALLDPVPEIQAAALRGLGELGDARAEAPLTERLADPDRDLRRTAVLALDRLANPAALERLRDSLDDPDREVRLIAVRALRRLPDARSEAELERLADSDPDPLVRRTAARVVDELRRRPAGEG